MLDEQQTEAQPLIDEASLDTARVPHFQSMAPERWQMLKEQTRTIQEAHRAGLINLPYGDNPWAIQYLVLRADEIGLPVGFAIQEMTVIKGGKLIIGSKALGALIKHHFGPDAYRIDEYARDRVSVHFKIRGQELDVDWSMDDAREAGLAGKDTYKGYPRAMLLWRCVAEGVRALAPDILAGLYVQEEMSGD